MGKHKYAWLDQKKKGWDNRAAQGYTSYEDWTGDEDESKTNQSKDAYLLAMQNQAKDIIKQGFNKVMSGQWNVQEFQKQILNYKTGLDFSYGGTDPDGDFGSAWYGNLEGNWSKWFGGADKELFGKFMQNWETRETRKQEKQLRPGIKEQTSMQMMNSPKVLEGLTRNNAKATLLGKY